MENLNIKKTTAEVNTSEIPAAIKKADIVEKMNIDESQLITQIINEINSKLSAASGSPVVVEVKTLSSSAEQVLKDTFEQAGWDIDIKYDNREFVHFIRVK